MFLNCKKQDAEQKSTTDVPSLQHNHHLCLRAFPIFMGSENTLSIYLFLKNVPKNSSWPCLIYKKRDVLILKISSDVSFLRFDSRLRTKFYLCFEEDLAFVEWDFVPFSSFCNFALALATFSILRNLILKSYPPSYISDGISYWIWLVKHHSWYIATRMV